MTMMITMMTMMIKTGNDAKHIESKVGNQDDDDDDDDD
jgi:hypothetical protein